MLPLNSLRNGQACFWDHIAFLLFLFGEPLVFLWGTLGSVAAQVGPPGPALGHPRSGLELLWGCLGIILGRIREKMSAVTPIASRWLSSTAPAHKIDPLEFARRSRRSRRSRQSRGNGPRTVNQDLPSTRAGDQDDVSLTNSLKLCSLGFICSIPS